MLKAVNKWIGEGEKATLVWAPMCIFWQQPSRYYEKGLQRGQQPSWSKRKAHREPANDGADILADKAISDSKLHTTSCGDICTPACKLYNHKRVSSGLSHLI